MKRKSISIRNFRLLSDLFLAIEEGITIIVGKNNTGKTSLFELIRIFTSGRSDSKISFEDFSQSCYPQFEEQYREMVRLKETVNLPDEEKEIIETTIKDKTPRIELLLSFEYDKAKDKLTSLSEFITDLNEERNDVSILIAYEPTNSLSLYSSYYKFQSENESANLISYLQKNITNYYKTNYYAVDTSSGYRKLIDKGFKEKLESIAVFEEIRALRILDDVKEDKNKSLAESFSKYYNDKEQQDEDIEAIKPFLEEMSNLFEPKYNEALKTPIGEIKDFGASSPLAIPDITFESNFDPEDVIRHNIKYYYTKNGINLPESSNGLGYSNLIYLIIQTITYIKKFKKSLIADERGRKNAKTLTILIEEPECHMHPQMQQIFIKGLKERLKKEREAGLDIQIIITSHSSHIIAEAGLNIESGFGQLRYFGRNDDLHYYKDFNSFQLKEEKETLRFLKKYLTLQKCDLFFADKAIMVEGLTERVLLTQMMAKAAPSFLIEYVTILEIGGAYCHKFKELLEFVGIKTLIITDLDSVNAGGCKCPVCHQDAVSFSNPTLREWLPKKETLAEIKSCGSEEKIQSGLIRVAYQIPEVGSDYNARSFEEAFIENNKSIILGKNKAGDKDTKNQFSRFKTKNIDDIKDCTSYELAPPNSAKSNFAFDIMNLDEGEYGEWCVPLYISEGLEWLASK